MHEENIGSGEQITNLRPRHARHNANGLGVNRSRIPTKVIRVDTVANENELHLGCRVLNNFRSPHHRLQALSGSHISSEDNIEPPFQRKSGKIATSFGLCIGVIRPVVNQLDLGIWNLSLTKKTF